MTTAAHPQLHAALERLATFNADPAAGGITREVFTPEYAAALAYVDELMQAVGLQTRVDAFGNLFGRWPGAEPGAAGVLTGSHVDTTLNAGRYDGTLGVLGAIEAVRLLRAGGHAPRRSIEVVAFAGEEPRFATGCIGSRALAGELTRADLNRLVDRDGVSLAAALSDAGLEPDRLAEARLDPDTVHAFVELHIEQGAVLESTGDDIGVVTAIAAPYDLRLTLRGAATHAGATPMSLRRDALAGAAELMGELERLAAGSPSGSTVGTVGVLRLRPGAINVVPGEVELDVDVRDVDRAVRDEVVDELLRQGRAIAERRRLELSAHTIVCDEPAPCDPAIVEAVRATCVALGVSHRTMASGAYHDAMVLAALVPIGMIFVPSAGGISHHPDEFTAPAQLDLGVDVLAGTLARLSL